MKYAVILTRIRPELPRDERTRPEPVICCCEFDDRDTALRRAREWSADQPVQAGLERVKTLVVEPTRHGREPRPVDGVLHGDV